jgi:hypothetical protein
LRSGAFNNNGRVVWRVDLHEVFDVDSVNHLTTEINGIFNSKPNAQEEAVNIQMVRDAAKKDKEHLFDLRMKVMQEIDPFTSPAAELRLHHFGVRSEGDGAAARGGLNRVG